MSRARTAFLALLVFCSSTLHGLPGVSVESECHTGGFLKVEVIGTYHPAAKYAELRNGAGEVLSENVLFELPEGADSSQCAIIGVPDSLETGIYRVTLTSATGSVVESRLIKVTSLEYRTETIHLNESLSGLRQTDNRRRMEEAKKMWELTHERNPDALYHFAPFQVPVEDGVITSSFGDRRLFIYIDARSERSVHTGIDLAAPIGTPVLCSGSGRVVLAADRLITGNTVVIEHLPGLYSLYYHLDTLSVVVGELVSEGGVIGTLGSSGLATGPHLHWEFRIGGVSVDPSVMAGLTF